MKAERDIERKIKQKEEEVRNLREKLIQAEAYLDAMQESLRLIQRTTSDHGSGGIRLNSMIDKARKILRREGKAMHVADILQSMGKEASQRNKVSLSGSLGNYVRQKFVFTRPDPNTFGLIEFGEVGVTEDGVPEGFGLNDR